MKNCEYCAEKKYYITYEEMYEICDIKKYVHEEKKHPMWIEYKKRKEEKKMNKELENLNDILDNHKKLQYISVSDIRSDLTDYIAYYDSHKMGKGGLYKKAKKLLNEIKDMDDKNELKMTDELRNMFQMMYFDCTHDEA